MAKPHRADVKPRPETPDRHTAGRNRVTDEVAEAPLYRPGHLRQHRARILRLTPPMKTEDLMTRNVAACRPGDSLEQAAHLMWEWDVGCVVVTDNQQKPIGMITDRDVAMPLTLRERCCAKFASRP